MSEHVRSHWNLSWIGSDRALARHLARPTARFLQVEAASGVLLLAATVVALVWANSPWSDSYTSLWSSTLELGVGSFTIEMTLLEFVNDGLMALFFFVAGMEIKRELVNGELQDPKAASLPILAALGGMVVPALIYTAVNHGGVGAKGWGIPMATDIAFAVGIVSLLGNRVPVQLKLFLLTLAVADDLGAIAVIAVFYAQAVHFAWLAVVAGSLAVVWLLRRVDVVYTPVYVVVGVVTWYAMWRSGVHATVAGVLLGFMVPTSARRPDLDAQAIADQLENQPELNAADVKSASILISEAVPVNERLVDRLAPWTSFVVIPVFALANAGLSLSGSALSSALGSSITIGVALGLVVGKTIGVAGASWLAVKAGLARRPDGATGLHMIGISMAAGIGFTVALFVTGLAFTDVALQDEAKVGIFIASIVAAVLSAVVLLAASRREPPEQRRADELGNVEFFAPEVGPEVVTT